MEFRQTVRVGGLRLRQQRQPFRIALQHGIEQGHWPLRRFLADSCDARTRRQAHVPTVEGDLTGDSTEQRGFSGPVASHKTDPPAGVDRQVGSVQQRTAAHTNDGAGDDEERHGRGLAPEPSPWKHGFAQGYHYGNTIEAGHPRRVPNGRSGDSATIKHATAATTPPARNVVASACR